MEALHVTYRLLTLALELEKFSVSFTLDHFYILWFKPHSHGDLPRYSFTQVLGHCSVSHSSQPMVGITSIIYLSCLSHSHRTNSRYCGFIPCTWQPCTLHQVRNLMVELAISFWHWTSKHTIIVRCPNYTSLHTPYSPKLTNTHTWSTSTKYKHTPGYNATRNLINWLGEPQRTHPWRSHSHLYPSIVMNVVYTTPTVAWAPYATLTHTLTHLPSYN